MVRNALFFAAELVVSICGGRIIKEYIDTNPTLEDSRVIELDLGKVSQTLGLQLHDEEVAPILASLSIERLPDKNVARFKPPSYRFDLVNDYDHIEEVARNKPSKIITTKVRLQDQISDDDCDKIVGIFNLDTGAKKLAGSLEEKVTEVLRGFDGGKVFISRADEITFTTHLVTQSEELKEFSKHKVFSSLCLDLIGKNVRLYWDQAVYKKPGTQDEFPWHQDNGYTFIEPQAYLTCWLALNDTDESNGCPWVVPCLLYTSPSPRDRG